MSQDLRRTPTSAGNQKVFTYSCWIKRNKITDWMRLLSIMNGSTDAIIQLTNVDKLRFRDEVTSPDIDYISSRPLRDAGSWMHLLVAIDTTATQAEHRIRMYINGDSLIEHGLDTESMPGDKNLDLQFNDKLEHRFFARNNDSEYFFGEAFDLFWVDGQALTPDVFGFNKDGDGYVSVGSTQTTDFRPGQWVPKAPRTIKSEINRRGGFGVNGFYLPMNDSSNFGADFHCTPNSIIKLKGEDLPQPRNGLPTTSDDYVSQLRSDPYAANLVLAVPGVNTQPTGSELVTNGTFDTDVSGWTITDTGTIVRQSDGTAKVTRGSSAEVVYQDITTVVGTTYELSVDITDIAGSHGQVYVKSTPHSGSLNTNIGYSFYTGTYKGTFTADTTTTRIILYAHPSGSTSYDNISVKSTTIRDYHADIKGSGTNKTITAYADAGVRNPNGADGFNVNGYYGSALHFDGTTDYMATSLSAIGTNDFTIEFWIYPKAISGSYVGPIGLTAATNVKRIEMAFQSSTLQIYTDTGAWRDTGFAPPTNQWTHIALEKYNGYLTAYANGVAVWAVTNTRDYDESFNVKIGKHVDTLNGYMQDVRVYSGVAKYKGGFDVPKPYNPTRSLETWRQFPDNCKNNFCTMNPLNHNNGTFANGNLTTSEPAANGAQIYATMGSNTGKWYYEAHVEDVGTPNTGGTLIGINPLIRPSSNIQNRTAYRSEGSMYNDSGTTSGSSAYAYVSGDTIGVAWDADNKRLWFAKNGTWLGSGDPAGNSNPNVNYTNTETQGPFIAYDNGTGAQVTHLNFGQNPTFSGTVTAGTYTDSNGKGLFKYQPPSGFLALCEDNLPTPTIADPGDYFKTVLYEGDNVSNGVGRRAVRGVGFKPDLVWIKCRDQAQNHVLYDSVRGLQCLNSNDVAVESTFDSQILGGYDEDGFTTSPNNDSNYNGQSFVAWCWKAGGAAVSNTDGSITSQVSVNQDAGFSIVSFTSTSSGNFTIGHGLGKTPKLIITKERGASNNWHVWHSGVMTTSSQFLMLNSTAALGSYSNVWGTSIPTSLVFGANVGSLVNASTASIAYCWAEIENFSKFGSYTGTGGTDGAFVYCGFKPAWVMIKRTDASNQWQIQDASRNSTNPTNMAVYAEASSVEEFATSTSKDFLSNGFKIRGVDTMVNASGGSYIFMAFAESPFQTANAK